MNTQNKNDDMNENKTLTLYGIKHINAFNNHFGNYAFLFSYVYDEKMTLHDVFIFRNDMRESIFKHFTIEQMKKINISFLNDYDFTFDDKKYDDVFDDSYSFFDCDHKLSNVFTIDYKRLKTHIDDLIEYYKIENEIEKMNRIENAFKTINESFKFKTT